MAGRSFGARRHQVDVAALARCHRLCLPETASSHAGQAVVEGLYAALLDDSAAHVVWYPGANDPHHYGAFAAGTISLRDTESKTRRGLSLTSFARLAFRIVCMPRHVMARRNWESLIPRDGVGYVLTLGVAGAIVPSAATPRGSAILAELEAWFVTQGCFESWVDTELSNRRANAFYARAGYREVARAFGQVLLKKVLG